MRSLVLLLLAAAIEINAQDGFVSIDCGVDGDSNYYDTTTGIIYEPDAKYIDSGVNYMISKNYMYSTYPAQAETLRSFPNGSRNCYTIYQINKGDKYLIRALFLYGNYDGHASVVFHLHLGVNFWQKMNVSDSSTLFQAEIITIAPEDYFSVCLVSIGSGTPFISSLELRHIDTEVFKDVNESNSLVLTDRVNAGANTDQYIRYPNDTYDRLWRPFVNPNYWINLINSSDAIQTNPEDAFRVPDAVMATAVTPADNISLMFGLYGDTGNVRPQYYIYMHFADFDGLTQTENRIFQVFVNNKSVEYVKTLYRLVTHISLPSEPVTAPEYNFALNKTTDASVLPPILNAVEVYNTLNLPDNATYRDDVDAMMALKNLYNMTTWQGDPCSPRQFQWYGVDCYFSSPNPPRITYLNLSTRGLNGTIPNALAELTAIRFLDLSYNKFTGPIPTFLAALQSLRMLNLSNNLLSGLIPPALLVKQENGLLDLRMDNNTNLCTNATACQGADENKRKKLAVPVIVVISAIAVIVVLLLIIILVYLMRKRQSNVPPPLASSRQLQALESKPIEEKPVFPDTNHFTHQELKIITKNFERTIGKGGFGTVYYGCLLDGTEVAVKVRSVYITEGIIGAAKSSSTSDGTKEFLAEISLLSRVHHRNLVSLIGYCRDGNFLGLVYEYIAQGSLKDHLSGKASNSVLKWRERLQIAIEAALGLEYLHKGCQPPIIHRDVKSSNILLDHNYKAKIADFGLSKAFQSDTHTHVSTEVVVGTPGYVDPEYHNTFQLTEKSDVYSFGVVLLELVTGLPPVLRYPERGHILQWLRSRLAQADITEVIDSRLERQYNINSILKVIDLALSCTSTSACKRPTLSEVVMHLKDSLQLEASHRMDHNTPTEELPKTPNDSLEMAQLDMTATMSSPIAR